MALKEQKSSVLGKNDLSVPTKMFYGVVWDQEWVPWINFLVIFSIKSTCSVFTLCETLMEMAEYVKNKKLRKCLRPKVNTNRKINQRY